jgi:hypothetical protein
MSHSVIHQSHRVDWLRAAVLGNNDIVHDEVFIYFSLS